jgi:hypothetical protein
VRTAPAVEDLLDVEPADAVAGDRVELGREHRRLELVAELDRVEPLERELWVRLGRELRCRDDELRTTQSRRAGSRRRSARRHASRRGSATCVTVVRATAWCVARCTLHDAGPVRIA